MLLNLKTLGADAPETGKAPVFSCELDLSAVRLWGERPFSQPVRVSGHADRRAGYYNLRYEADFATVMRCSRCLAPVERAYRKEFAHVVLEEAQSGDYGDEVVIAPNTELDLDELVISDLLFELSEVPLCGENCLGLCPKCGKNLNEGKCGCDLRVPDSRFDVLRNLLEE